MQLRAAAGTLLTMSFSPPSTSFELRNPVWRRQRWPMRSWSFPWPRSWSNQQIFSPSINCSRWSTGGAWLPEVEGRKRGSDTKPNISIHPTPPQEQSYQNSSLYPRPWGSPLTTKTNSCREPTVLSLVASHNQGLSILPTLPLFFKPDRGGKLSCCPSGHGWPPKQCWLLAGCCGVQRGWSCSYPGQQSVLPGAFPRWAGCWAQPCLQNAIWMQTLPPTLLLLHTACSILLRKVIVFFCLSQYSWFFFEALAKSMAIYLLEENKIKVKMNLFNAALQSHHKQTLPWIFSPNTFAFSCPGPNGSQTPTSTPFTHCCSPSSLMWPYAIMKSPRNPEMPILAWPTSWRSAVSFILPGLNQNYVYIEINSTQTYVSLLSHPLRFFGDKNFREFLSFLGKTLDLSDRPWHSICYLRFSVLPSSCSKPGMKYTCSHFTYFCCLLEI